MKKILISSLLLFTLFLSAQEYNLPAASPRQKIENQFSISKISIDYGRPSVKDRKIFGDLVPFGQVWRLGANAASKISFEQDVLIGDKWLKAGTYAIYAKPEAKYWTIIINKGVGNWGAYTYDSKEDVLTLDVPVQPLNEKVELFTMSVDEITDLGMKISIQWDKTKVMVPIKIADANQVNTVVENLKNIKKIDSEARKAKEKK